VSFSDIIERAIKDRVAELPQGIEDQELLKIIREAFQLKVEDEDDFRVMADLSIWPDKKSFCSGIFIYDNGSFSDLPESEGAFTLILVSPDKISAEIKTDNRTAVLYLKFDDELMKFLQYLAVINQGDFPENVIRTRRKELENRARARLFQVLLNSDIEYRGKKERVMDILASEQIDQNDIYNQLKSMIFNEDFTRLYFCYPNLPFVLEPGTIKNEIEQVIKEILLKKEGDYTEKTRKLLSALGLLDKNDCLDCSNSIYAEVVKDRLRKADKSGLEVKDILRELNRDPFGLQEELAYLILFVLTVNGVIRLKEKDGIVITASDIKSYFSPATNNLFSSVYTDLKSIYYLDLESPLPLENIRRLFNILQLDPDLLSKDGDYLQAFREFKKRIEQLKQKVAGIDLNLSLLKKKGDHYFDLEPLFRKREGLDDFPLKKFLSIQTVTDFRLISFDHMEWDRIEIGLKFLDNYADTLTFFVDNIYNNYINIQASLEMIKSRQGLFKEEDITTLEDIVSECENLLDKALMLFSEEEREKLRSMIGEYQLKYIEIYYQSHQRNVGQGIDWNRLEKITADKVFKELQLLSGIKGIKSDYFSHLEGIIKAAQKIRCERLRRAELEEIVKDGSGYRCPYCDFPVYSQPELAALVPELPDLNLLLREGEKRISTAGEELKKELYEKIAESSGDIELLSDMKKEIVKEIYEKGDFSLVGEEGVNLVIALNRLFSLKKIELSSQDLINYLFAGKDIIKYELFIERLDQLKQMIAEKGEKRSIYVKVK